MKKVILAQTIIMTVLMGCSFSKDQNKPAVPSETPLAQSAKTPENAFQKLILEAELHDLKDAIQTKSQADLNQNFPDGSTPLENAALRGDVEVIRHLAQLGASPFVANTTTKKSLYQEVGTLKLEQKKPSSLELFKYHALRAGISRSKSQIRSLLKSKSFEELLTFVITNQTPASEVIPAITRGYRDHEIPLAIIEKLIKVPSMQNDELFERLVKDASYILLDELDTQLNKVLPHFALAEFISGKMPNKFHGYWHYSDKEDRTYFVNPSLLLWWRNIKYPARHENFSTYLQKITRFPEALATIYCPGKCKTIDEAKFSITIDELRNDENFWGNTILNDSLAEASGDFWNPEEEE
ncbi:ankyrin repeat domain-containing protein [Bdellovibrio bacteriovorus]|uniref:Ankyrin repeat domain-containing protein n=1 Tax=Bdellovibrio bacteriovorus TaxID=959 RepID=A0A1Z3N502_BDEBC|nr:ankyrin repeat domain-containing protein [Bdellovibrio bacteriovorus]ASD62554.1 hypothetical protein B9G79_02700 [Bdellovibrio bacteriovorus]